MSHLYRIELDLIADFLTNPELLFLRSRFNEKIEEVLYFAYFLNFKDKVFLWLTFELKFCWSSHKDTWRIIFYYFFAYRMLFSNCAIAYIFSKDAAELNYILIQNYIRSARFYSDVGLTAEIFQNIQQPSTTGPTNSFRRSRANANLQFS